MSKISEQLYDQITQENLEPVKKVNLDIDEDQQLEVGLKSEWVTNSENQITAIESDICLALGEEIKRSIGIRSPAEIDTVRDISIKLAQKHNDLESALALMKILLKQRPNGLVIKRKVEEWSSKLNAKADE